MDSSFNMRLKFVNIASEAIYNEFGSKGLLNEGVLAIIINSFGVIGNKAKKEVISFNTNKGFKVTEKDYNKVLDFKKALDNKSIEYKALLYFNDNLVYLKTSSFEVNRFIKSCYRFL